MLKSSLCGYSDAYILVKGTISFVGQAGDNPNNNNKKVVSKNCAPFTDFISEINNTQIDFFFSIYAFFHEHSRFTGQQGKGEGISLTSLYHFHLLYGHLDINRAITAESLPLHIASSRTRTGNLWFLRAQVANH